MIRVPPTCETLASNASTGKEMLEPAHRMASSCQLKYGEAQFHRSKRALGRRSHAVASVTVRALPRKGTPNRWLSLPIGKSFVVDRVVVIAVLRLDLTV